MTKLFASLARVVSLGLMTVLMAGDVAFGAASASIVPMVGSSVTGGASPCASILPTATSPAPTSQLDATQASKDGALDVGITDLRCYEAFGPPPPYEDGEGCFTYHFWCVSDDGDLVFWGHIVVCEGDEIPAHDISNSN